MATGDQTLINFPRESTMQEISQALQTMAFTQSADLEKISTWAQFSGLSRNGITQKIFDFGDQILEKWTDTAANNKEYDFPWHITHFDTAEENYLRRRWKSIIMPGRIMRKKETQTK